MSAASKAKRLNPNLEVIAFEKTAHVSYSACGIPYYVADLVREADELVTVTPEEFLHKRDIQVLTKHEVVDIRPTKRQITVINLQDRSEQNYDYDKLLIAVGGRPRLPRIFQKKLRNVFTIQTLQDGIDIKQIIDEQRPKRVVIVGGGYIAMEMAEACRHRGLEVNIVEKKPQLLSNFEKEISEVVLEELIKNKVRIHTATEVSEIETNSFGEVTSIAINDGFEKIATDLVLVCIGLSPNTQLSEIAGLRHGNTGGIAVDWKMETSQSKIYAAGDCVEVKNLVTGKPGYFPLGPTANKQGRVAGENIGGGTAMFRGVVGTSVFKTFHLEVAKTGLSILEAKTAGFVGDSVFIREKSKAGYYPGAEEISIAMVFDKRGGRLLGTQMVGKEGVSKRIDILATALINRMQVNEIPYLDLSYAPPFAPVWDPVLVAANVAKSKLRN